MYKTINIPQLKHDPAIAFFGTDEEIAAAELNEESVKNIYKSLLSDPSFQAFQLDEEREHDTRSIICSRSFVNVDGWRLSYISSVYGPVMHEEYIPEGGVFNGLERMFDELMSKSYKKSISITALYAA